MGNKQLIPAVENLSMNRFMGDWWVIANIPLPPEKNAFNALEQYKLASNDLVEITFSFNEGGFDKERKVKHAKGFVQTSNPSRWNVQFFWPIKAEYVVCHVDPEYQYTIIGRTRRDYVWIMARTQKIDDAVFQNLKQKVKELGYDESQLKMVPQDPSKLKATQ